MMLVRNGITRESNGDLEEALRHGNIQNSNGK